MGSIILFFNTCVTQSRQVHASLCNQGQGVCCHWLDRNRSFLGSLSAFKMAAALCGQQCKKAAAQCANKIKKDLKGWLEDLKECTEKLHKRKADQEDGKYTLASAVSCFLLVASSSGTFSCSDFVVHSLCTKKSCGECVHYHN